jgi:hypothetical protein
VCERERERDRQTDRQRQAEIKKERKMGATLYTKMNFTNSFLGTAVLMLQLFPRK